MSATATALPTFATYYSALHGRIPFPWQVRLACKVLECGWPALMELPTGVGKTSVLDVALYCLALAPGRMPRRTLMVVDRRVVIDQGANHARQICKTLQAATSGPLKVIAQRLRGLFDAGDDEPPFAVAVLRGGMPRDNDWATRPDQPVLGFSTVDQVGSRLLFRGYGVGLKSASIHAGLLANDTLMVLDEVQLGAPFAQTLGVIQSRFSASAPGLPNRFAVVQMSATSGVDGDKAFKLDGADQVDATLALRLGAPRWARLLTVAVGGDDEGKKRELLAQQAVTEALSLQAAGARVVGLVVNRIDTAREALQLLRQRKGTDVVLVTGRMRAIDRDDIERSVLLPRAGAGRIRSESERPLVVVATQCIEAADLDFDGLVTECASLDALRLRFGRVDRRGELQRSASVVLGRSDSVAGEAHDPIYGAALANTWRWLNSVAVDGAVDFGLAALELPTNSCGRSALLAPVLAAPVLLPAHLDAWVQTSPLPAPDPDVSLWLHGPRKNAADVQILWRVGAAWSAQGLSRLIDQLTAVRPSSLEAVTVPLGAARRWLSGAPSSAIADVIAGDAEGSEDDAWHHDVAEMTPLALRWNGDDSVWVGAQDLRPGDVLVVDTKRGGLAEDSFDPGSTDAVVDLGDLSQVRGRGIASLRLVPEAMRAWSSELCVSQAAEFLGLTPGDVPQPVADEARTDLTERVGEWLALFPRLPPTCFVGTPNEWRAVRNAFLSDSVQISVVAGQLLVSAPVAKMDLDPESGEAGTEDDASSFSRVETLLQTHSEEVQGVAARFSNAVGFSAAIAADVTLAAWLHDVGKADPRFQRWLVGGDVRASGGLLAKSALSATHGVERRRARNRSGYPSGYRHELLSVDMISRQEGLLSQAHDKDLVLHLVGSHHGWCRPFAPPIDPPDDLVVQLRHGEEELSGVARHRLARLDSGVADRFWTLIERYGWWGLAWLEAVLRLADHEASEPEQEGPCAR